MSLLARKKQLAAKVETVKGTRESSLSASDADVLVEDVRFVYAPDPIVRNPLRSSISTKESIPGAKIATITFRAELRGSGTATTPPSWGKFLTACGFVESVNTSNVTYTPDSDDGDVETLTMHVYNDGILDIMYGARGNVAFEFVANQRVMTNFTFQGIFYDRTDTAMLTGITYESTLPVPWRDGTIAFNLGGSWTGAVLSTLSFDMNNSVVLRQNANAADGLSYAIIPERDPGGNMDPDRVLVATQDWVSHIETPTTGELSWVAGSAAGNTLSFSAPKCQILGLDDTDRESVAVDGLTFKFRENSGDDEFVITHS